MEEQVSMRTIRSRSEPLGCTVPGTGTVPTVDQDLSKSRAETEDKVELITPYHSP